MPGWTHDRRRHALSVGSSLPRHLVHVGGRATEVRQHAREPLHPRQLAHLAEHAPLGPALDDAPLVLRDAAERAAAEAAAHRDDRVLHRLEGGHLLAVARVRPPLEREIVEVVHLLLVERLARPVEVDRLVPVDLQQRPAVVRVRLVLERAAHLREGELVLLHLVVGRQDEELLVRDVAAHVGEQRLPFAAARLHVRGAADVGEALDRLARVEALRDLPGRQLAHAEDHQVGFAVEQDGTPYFVRPVVVVGDATQRRLDAADDDRHARERAASEVRVDEGRAVGTAVRGATGGVLVDGARLLLRRQLVEHRVEVARADAHEEPRSAHACHVGRRGPVGLGDDADLVAATLEKARDEDRAEGGMIDVRVARDDEDVELGPAARIHLGARRRQGSARCRDARPPGRGRAGRLSFGA